MVRKTFTCLPEFPGLRSLFRRQCYLQTKFCLQTTLSTCNRATPARHARYGTQADPDIREIQFTVLLGGGHQIQLYSFVQKVKQMCLWLKLGGGGGVQGCPSPAPSAPWIRCSGVQPATRVRQRQAQRNNSEHPFPEKCRVRFAGDFPAPISRHHRFFQTTQGFCRKSQNISLLKLGAGFSAAKKENMNKSNIALALFTPCIYRCCSKLLHSQSNNAIITQ